MIPHPVWHCLQIVVVGQTVSVVGWTAILVHPHSNVTAADDTGKPVSPRSILQRGQAKMHVCPMIRSRVIRTVSKAQPGVCARRGAACCRRDCCRWPERARLCKSGRQLDQCRGICRFSLSGSNLDWVRCHHRAVFVSLPFMGPGTPSAHQGSRVTTAVKDFMLACIKSSVSSVVSSMEKLDVCTANGGIWS